MTALFDFEKADSVAVGLSSQVKPRVKSRAFLAFKRFLDLFFAIPLALIAAIAAAFLLVLNPIANPGPLLFTQMRMGRGCKPFKVYKFRTMTAGNDAERSADCPLEVDRITPLGGLMRRLRIDELPQVLNILRGDMSLIGPRPDAYHHAKHYIQNVPGYVRRHAIRPGISGLAQTEVGYVESTEGTRRKVEADLYYIHNMGLRMEAYIIWRSVVVVLRRDGA